MATNVVALFEDFQSAHSAVRELRDVGIPHSDISLVAPDVTGEYGRALAGEPVGNTTGSETGASVGAVLGGLGGLLVGLGMLAVPGIGPLLVAGPLGTVLAGLVGAATGTLAGSAAGGLVGALIDLGLSEEEASHYTIRKGYAVVGSCSTLALKSIWSI